uniref:Ribonuclease H-like domain-containing protein n=1 Tax=Tanacetum cinerariifolium TaxID=118510 RepID=A0A699GIH5_TANCI|nr:ribonuclease H-like domain-containing protein [Tanacetum cinerariifolium]
METYSPPPLWVPHLNNVDDYSKVAWVYFVKTKDDVFVSYIKLIHNQFDIKIKTVRSDNESEFVNKKMHTMFCDLGIVNQTSCAHTPQQDEIAERKHRHLLNVARGLMFQEGIHLRFWSGLYQEGWHSAIQVDDQNWSEGNVQSNSPSPTQLGDNLDYVQTLGLRRSTRQSKLHVKLNDYVLSSNVNHGIEKYVYYSKLKGDNLCFATILNKSVEPTCLKDALSDSNWVEAMNNEIEALNRNIFGEVKRYKARLVAKGFSQKKAKEGFDNDETFSHVVKMVIFRCLISIIVSNSWPLYQLDVNNASLYGDLKEDVYMSLSEGYESSNKHKVCKLNKSLYGLKQAPRQWNAKLTTALIEHGFEQSKFDYSLYVKKKGSMFVALLVYVNDIVITGNDKVEIKSFKIFLSSKFLIKDLGELKYFMEIEVLKNDKENTVLSHVETDKDKLLKFFTSYQKLVGKLIYLTHTRPDISYVVHCLSQHMHSPLSSHFKANLRVLRYLKGSPSLGLQFNKSSDLRLKAYGDADWARCPKTRKSITEYYVFLENYFISWKGKRQATLSRSSAEAEYRSMASTTCEIIWLGNLLYSLELKDLYPVPLFCDNSSTIQIDANPFYKKTKLFELDVRIVRDKWGLMPGNPFED